MPELNRSQGQLVAYVVGLAADRPGMSQRQVLDDLVAGFESTDSGRGWDALAHRWQVTPEELAEVAGVLDEQLQSRPVAAGLPASPRPVPAASQPEPSWPVECSDRDAYGTCIHRLKAGLIGTQDLCRGCTRLDMDVWNGVIPDLEWSRQAIERAGMPAEEVSLQ